MAATVVKDSQLRLDPIISQDVRIESAFPTLEIRETDQTLPAGLWRIVMNGNELFFDQNLAVAGDFSPSGSPLTLVERRVKVTEMLEFTGSVVIATAVDNTFFRDSANSKRIVYNNSDGAHRVQFHDDVITRETPSGALNGVNVTFTLANASIVAGSEEVYLNGILQEPGGSDDYTISGVTITYNTAPLSTDRLRVSYLKS